MPSLLSVHWTIPDGPIPGYPGIVGPLAFDLNYYLYKTISI